MPGLDPGIHVLMHRKNKGVDGRDKPGHDEIIEAHGGRLWATANLPRGAIFQFTVPAGLDETSP